ncbi:microprocessor complex subunit DGCR8 isoform X1 [Vespula maculifrons]|uniref:Microprocessor complex subunit DGCR8 isoform X1 n=1 Tax=Vespula maculifrons TaxID=7453 RepID=A0ABD2BQ13_VESMC
MNIIERMNTQFCLYTHIVSDKFCISVKLKIISIIRAQPQPQTANTNANVQFSLPFFKWFQIDWTLASLVKVVWPHNKLDT